MSFARVKPLGWALFETLTSSQMTQLDIDHAKATDGTYVKDYGAALFLPTKISTGTWTRTSTVAYVSPLNAWVGCAPGGSCRTVGASQVIAATTFPTGLSAMQSDAIAFDGSSVLVCGGSGVGTANIRRTTVAANCDVWTTQSSVTSSNCTTLGWFGAVGRFIAGYGNGHVESSLDGITWTASTTPHALAHTGFACNGTIAVLVQNNSSDRTTYATSTDGVTWTSRTFPVTPNVNNVWSGVSYSPIDGVFLAITGAGQKVLKSADGINWTAVTATFAPSIGAFSGIPTMRSLSNLWLVTYTDFSSVNGLMCSIDVGATWKPLFTSANTVSCIGNSTGQIVVVDAANAYFSNMLSL